MRARTGVICFKYNIMEKELVTFEQALALQELGFDEECIFVNLIENGNFAGIYTPTDYNDFPEQREIEINVPLKQQVFRWFREKHECYANLSSWIHEEEIGIYHEFEIYKVKQYSHGSIRFKTYEEAENACIDKLIELTKTK
jgi:hypothetical protein